MDAETTNVLVRSFAVAAGVIFGSVSIGCAVFVWVRKQVFGYGGTVLCTLGVVLLGLSVWGSVEVNVGVGQLALKLSSIEKKIDDNTQAVASAAGQIEQKIGSANAQVQQSLDKNTREIQASLDQLRDDVAAAKPPDQQVAVLPPGPAAIPEPQRKRLIAQYLRLQLDKPSAMSQEARDRCFKPFVPRDSTLPQVLRLVSCS